MVLVIQARVCSDQIQQEPAPWQCSWACARWPMQPHTPPSRSYSSGSSQWSQTKGCHVCRQRDKDNPFNDALRTTCPWCIIWLLQVCLPGLGLIQQFTGDPYQHAVGKGRLEAWFGELVEHLGDGKAIILPEVIQQAQGMVLEGRKQAGKSAFWWLLTSSQHTCNVNELELGFSSVWTEALLTRAHTHTHTPHTPTWSLSVECTIYLDHDVVTRSSFLSFIHPTLHHIIAHLHHVLNTEINNDIMWRKTFLNKLQQNICGQTQDMSLPERRPGLNWKHWAPCQQ